MQIRTLFLTALFTFVTLGCSSLATTGSFSREDANISRYDGVYFSDDVADLGERLEQKYLTLIARVLERNGLKLVDKTSRPSVLACKAVLKPAPLGKGVHISLWDRSGMVFAAESFSGVLRLSEDGALQSLVEANLGRLDRELLRSRK